MKPRQTIMRKKVSLNLKQTNMKRKAIRLFSKLRSDNIKAGMQRNIFEHVQGLIVNTGLSVQQPCEKQN